MTTDTSATAHEETPHANETFKTTTSDALIRRAQALINDRSTDPQWRTVIRYALETSDPWLADLVRRADEGEMIIDTIDFSQTPASGEDDENAEKIETLTRIICRAGDEPATKSAALLVLMATLENCTHPKVLANLAKHLALNRCSRFNLYGMVDAQVKLIESALPAENT